MEENRQYLTVLSLLAEGAVIEQTSEAPLAYRVKHGGKSAPLPGGVVQQLMANNRIRPSCKVNGRLLYVTT